VALPSANPIELAGGSLPERNHEIAKLEGFEARVGMHDDVRGHRIGKAEVIGGRDAVDEHAGLVAPRQRVDHGAGIGIGQFAGQAVDPGLVVESARDAADLLAARQPVKRLVDSLARPEIEEIDGRPGAEGGSLLHPTKDVRFQTQGIPTHRRFLCQKYIYIFLTKIVHEE